MHVSSRFEYGGVERGPTGCGGGGVTSHDNIF